MTIIVAVCIFLGVLIASVVTDLRTLDAIDVADTNRNQL
jgi:hypothetical protein